MQYSRKKAFLASFSYPSRRLGMESTRYRVEWNCDKAAHGITLQRVFLALDDIITSSPLNCILRLLNRIISVGVKIMDIFKILGSSLLSVAALFVVTKIMGHKQVAQLDFFDYVSGITIGSIGAELATELESPQRPLIALVVYGFASVGLNMLTNKFPRTRKYINGTPTILLDSGRLYRKNLNKAKLDLSEFMILCREQGYFDLEEIETAVFEHNGKLSVLPKASSRPVTPSDLKITTKASRIATELIMDGRIMGENLMRIGKDEIWLKNELKLKGYKSEREIFLAVYRAGNNEIVFYPNE